MLPRAARAIRSQHNRTEKHKCGDKPTRNMEKTDGSTDQSSLARVKRRTRLILQTRPGQTKSAQQTHPLQLAHTSLKLDVCPPRVRAELSSCFRLVLEQPWLRRRIPSMSSSPLLSCVPCPSGRHGITSSPSMTSACLCTSVSKLGNATVCNFVEMCHLTHGNQCPYIFHRDEGR